MWLFEDVIQAAYEVDLFGRVHRAIEVANANAASVAAARDDVRIVVAAQTAKAYAAVCALGEQLDVAHHSLEVVSREAQITVARQEDGADSIFDVERAQALVSEVQSSIPDLEGERDAALFELTALLGRTPAEAPRDLETCLSPPALVAMIPVGDGAELIRRRPDVREAERRLAAATAGIGVVAGGASNLDLLTTEQSLVALDASVAAADAALIQDQIAVFKSLGGGWHNTE